MNNNTSKSLDENDTNNTEPLDHEPAYNSPATSQDDISDPSDNYNYSSLIMKLEESIEHLQKIVQNIKEKNISEQQFTEDLAHAMTDINEGYNHRFNYEIRAKYKVGLDVKDHGDYDMLPWEIVMEWARFMGLSKVKSMHDFTFKGNLRVVPIKTKEPGIVVSEEKYAEATVKSFEEKFRNSLR